MIVAVSPEEAERMTFEEIVRAHIDRLGMSRSDAEVNAWFLTVTEEELVMDDGTRMPLE